MNLRRWDIVFLRVDDKDPTGHPAVILSGENTLEDARQQRFNVLLGTKKPPAASTGSHQVLLNGADGLDHLTQVDCSLVYVARRASVIRLAGTVSLERRREIQRKVRAYLGLG
ncbi:MAG: hypothetical protein HYV96_11140 [Opitutae bacterium]|nr:hypothetical protein [Opitutae bacterium]